MGDTSLASCGSCVLPCSAAACHPGVGARSWVVAQAVRMHAAPRTLQVSTGKEALKSGLNIPGVAESYDEGGNLVQARYAKGLDDGEQLPP